MTPRTLGKLNALAAERAKKPGMYSDGGGLYLQVKGLTSKSWVFRYKDRDGPRERYFGLGSFNAVSLAEAREKARDCRNKIANGIDPIRQAEAEAIARRLEAAKAMTFRQCAEAYITAHKASWKNAKHRDQWGATLESYVYPHFGDLPVAQVDTALVVKSLTPIWKPASEGGKPETAARVRGRVEAVLSWAITAGYRTAPNPAAWAGHLSNLLPQRSTLSEVKHHAAMPYEQVGDFMADLQRRDGVAALALMFTVLTGVRTTEARGAIWAEIDQKKRLWTIPAARMKGRIGKAKAHVVPLSTQTLAVLKRAAQKYPSDGLIFPNGKRRLSENAMLEVLDRMGRGDVTVHGFRSSFRQWTAEQTAFPREIAEAALAHGNPDKVETAYQRGTFLEKRAELMKAWANFCFTSSVKRAAAVGLSGRR